MKQRSLPMRIPAEEGTPSLASHRPGPRQRAAAGLVAGLLILASLAIVPFASVPLVVVPGFIPAFGALTCGIDLVTAVLLLSQARIRTATDPGRLGIAYLFSVLIILPHLAAFPGALMADPLIGTSASAVWLWFVWHGGFGALVIFYATTLDRRTRAVGMFGLLAGMVAFVGLAIAMVTVGLPWLPNILTGTSYGAMNRLWLGPLVLLLNGTALFLVAVRLRATSTLHLWLTVALVAANVDVWLTVLANGRFTLGWYAGRVCSLLTGLVVLLYLLRELTVLYVRLDNATHRLRIMAHSDGLTGLANRFALDQGIEREWRRARQDGLPLSLLLIDIDHFKLFNDRYGHLAGDDCLRRVARQIEEKVRGPLDLAARYGGEEFVVLLPNTTREGARLIAERIRRAVHELAIPNESAPLKRVTISLGIAAIEREPTESSANALLAAADAALYASKLKGRNMVSEAA